MLYRVKVENTTKFNISDSTNSNDEIYKLIYDRTNGICEIEYNPDVRYIFKDIYTGTIHDLSSFRHSYSTLFLKEELESFTQLPFTDTPTSDDTELLEYFLEKFMLTRDKLTPWLLKKAGFQSREEALQEFNKPKLLQIKQLEEQIEKLKSQLAR